MEIEILRGYVNGFSNESNTVSLKIDTGLILNEHLQTTIKNIDLIYDNLSNFTNKYKKIIFYHTLRLIHANKEYSQYETGNRNVLYEKSPRYTADGDNLKYQIQKSLDFLVENYEYRGNSGWYGTHFINIMMKKNDIIENAEDIDDDTIPRTKDDEIVRIKIAERQKIRKKIK